jgi:hypothetical protein
VWLLRSECWPGGRTGRRLPAHPARRTGPGSPSRRGAGVKGVRALIPADAGLNLPRRRYSWGLQQLAVLFTLAGSYGQARKFVRAPPRSIT